MRARKIFILACVISLCFVIVSCDNQEEPTSNVKQSDPHVVVDQIEADAKADAELRNKLQPLLSEVGIVQFANGEMESIAYFEDIKLQDSPRTINIDTSHVLVYFQIQRSDLERFQALQSTIQVKGDAAYTLIEQDSFPGADWTRFHLDITNIRSSVQLVLGEVPTIELVDLNHDLAYRIVTDKLQYPYIVLNGFLHSGLLLASQEEDQLTFEFTQAIDHKYSNVSLYGGTGEWQGDRQYNLSFSDESLMQVMFDHVYATDGAYISRSAPTNHYVRWMPKSEWYAYPDNKRIGFSPRDRFYDFLLRSPTPDQYIGLIDPTLAINDGESNNHTLFLERKNQVPYLISSGIGSKFPIISGQWIDNHIFLYWTTKDITIIHTDTLEQEVLFEQHPSEGQIYSVVYEPDEQKLLITVSVQTIGADTFTIDIWQSSHLSVPIKLNIPSNQFVYNSSDNSHQPNVLVYNKGVLFTGVEDLNPVTLYRNEQQHEYKASGRLFMLNGDYAILQKLINGQERYVSWNLRSIKKEPIIIPKAPGNVRVFGSHLISAIITNNSTQEKQYYEYAAASNTWKLSTLTNVQPYLKYQSLDAIYRSE
jgi:hypothetical protein